MTKKNNNMVYLTGTCNWAKVFEHNRDMKGYDDQYVAHDGAYTIELILDDVELKKLHDAGSRIQGRELDDGTTRVSLHRKHTVKGQDGTVYPNLGGAPQVVDENNEPWVSTEEEPRLIGNGSTVEVAVSVQRSRRNRTIIFTTLEGVKVIEAVEFNGEGGGQQDLPF